MAPEYQLREEHFLVIDTSADCIKAGQADPYSPPAHTLSLTADKDLITYGHVTDWQRLEQLWSDVLFQHLQVKKSRNHSPVLLSIPTCWSRDAKEHVCKFFFEMYNVPGLYLADQSLMALYGVGAQTLTGMVVMMDWDRTQVVPIVDSVVQTYAVFSTPLGGKHVCQELKKYLSTDAQFKKDHGDGEVGDDLLRYLQETVCEVSLPTLDHEPPQKGRKEKEIPRCTIEWEGKNLTMGDARMKAAEILFNPRYAGLNQTNIVELIFESLNKCDIEKRPQIFSNIVFTGQWCQYKGLDLRFEKDVKKFLPLSEFFHETQVKEYKVAQMPEYLEQMKGRSQDAAYLGGCIVAKLVFADSRNYISKDNYNEAGPGILQSKGY